MIHPAQTARNRHLRLHNLNIKEPINTQPVTL